MAFCFLLQLNLWPHKHRDVFPTEEALTEAKVLQTIDSQIRNTEKISWEYVSQPSGQLDKEGAYLSF